MIVERRTSRRLLDCPAGKLLPDPFLVLRLRLEIKRLLPLIASLETPAYLQIGVAEMIVDHRVVRLELDRAFEMLDRLSKIALAEVSPAETVDEIAIIRALLHRLADQIHRFLDVEVL